MKVIKSVKLLSVGAVMAFSIIGNANATEVHGLHKIEVGESESCPPVPEADTWAMMAVGLGLVGMRLRRKSGKSANKLSVDGL
ncbi:PEP-CTERM sorting domain-containing protein [Sulfuriferula thiophila]|uniref:PEP-CTERM sorting domain-containing protein n=1 Tax=Sulfuriferula thiophila TaxID=1781211 RepID=UPI000F606D96|nr:PEP-CTERM sorting domain-containing protein [Sulfuriferula thiophila]